MLHQARFDLQHQWQKDAVFRQMGCLWRSGKSRLVGAIRDAKSSTERVELKPSNITSVHAWNAWVKSRTSKAFQVKYLKCVFRISYPFPRCFSNILYFIDTL